MPSRNRPGIAHRGQRPRIEHRHREERDPPSPAHRQRLDLAGRHPDEIKDRWRRQAGRRVGAERDAAGPRPSERRRGRNVRSSTAHWASVRSPRRSGRDEIWRIDAGGGTPQPVTDTGAHAASESWDGTLLYYSRGGALYSRAVTGGPERQVLTSILNREFYPTKNGIFYATRLDAKRPVSYEIRYQAFATGTNQTLYRFDSLGITQGLSVSPDEKTIIIGGVSPSKNADLMLFCRSTLRNRPMYRRTQTLSGIRTRSSSANLTQNATCGFIESGHRDARED